MKLFFSTLIVLLLSDAQDNEWLADSVAPIAHLNSWQNDVSSLSAPFTSSENLTFKQMVFPGVLFSPESYPSLEGPNLQLLNIFRQPLEHPYAFQIFTLFDEENNIKSRSGAGWFNFDILPSGGIHETEAHVTDDVIISYNVVDKDDNFYVGLRSGVKKLNPDLSESASYTFTGDNDQLFSIAIAPSGDVCVLLGVSAAKIIFMNTDLVILAEMDFATEFGVDDDDFTISNSAAFDTENGFDHVYVAVREYLVKVKWDRDAKDLTIIWNTTIGGTSDVDGLSRVGHGIGSSPSITEDNGVKYLVLTDGNVPYGLHYVKCLEGTSVSINVTFGEDRKTSTEQSTVVSGLRTVVVNNYFSDKEIPASFQIFCKVNEWVDDVCRATLMYSYGVAAYDLDPSTMKISKTWERTDISCASSIPVVSSPDYHPQVLYCVGIIPSDDMSIAQGVGMTTLEAMSWETGESYFQYELGRSPYLGATYAATTIHESGIFYGATGGLVHIYDKAIAQDDITSCANNIATSSTCNDGGICSCDNLLESYTCHGKLDIPGLPYTAIDWLCGESCQVCLGAPTHGFCSDVVDGALCNGVYLSNSECFCAEGISGKLCNGDWSDDYILTSGRDLPFNKCIYDGVHYRKARCTDNDDFVAIFAYSDPLCSYEYALEPPFSMKRDKCYDFYEGDVMISFENNSGQGECVSNANIQELGVDDEPTEAPVECVDTAEFSDICRYSSKMCTCSELLEITECGVSYTSIDALFWNEGDCNFQLLYQDIMELASVSEASVAEAMTSNCGYAMTNFQTSGSWSMVHLCACFASIPEEVATVILNCYISGFSLLSVWSTCLKTSVTLVERTITTDPDQICPLTCGMCGGSEPDVSIPTVAPTECTDIAEYSDVCRYSLSMCSCSELLEKTGCEEPYTAMETFSLNQAECDWESLVYDIRELYGESEDMASNCEYLISYYLTYGGWPEPQGCLCIGQVSEENASVLFNCEMEGESVLYTWSACLLRQFDYLQREITTDPKEICPASCGLCGNPEPTYPTAEPADCVDTAELSEICRYSLKMCTCSELLESTECGVSYSSYETLVWNEADCDFQLLVYNIMEVAGGSEDMLSNCGYVINYFKTEGSWPTLELCACFRSIPEEAATIILNCYVSGSSVLSAWSMCMNTHVTLVERTLTSDPTEICPATCGLCDASEPECEQVLEFLEETFVYFCPEGFIGSKWSDPKVCDFTERLDSGLYELTSTIYQESFERSLANGLFSSCSATCVYDLSSNASIAYEWLSWKDCWKKKTQGICFDEYANKQAQFADKIINDLCPYTAPSPNVECTSRVYEWNEAVADQTCKLDHGTTDKSVSAKVCDGWEVFQQDLEISLANRMFLSCRAWCVYNVNAISILAFVWRPKGCWEPSLTCISVYTEEHAAMTEYVDNVLCTTDNLWPTLEPTCIPELEWSEDLMDEHCTVSGTKVTFKHYASINREPVACSGSLQDTLSLKKSLANNLFDNCGAWCVFDWSTQALEAWSWTSSGSCWTRRSDGWCFFDKNANTQSQMWTSARWKLSLSCNLDAATICYKEYEWTQERADEVCAPSSYGNTDKSYSGAYVCSDDSERQSQLEKSLANQLYQACNSWCVYNWDTLMAGEIGGYIWNNQNKCYKWVTGGACFNAYAAEYLESRGYVLETCIYDTL